MPTTPEMRLRRAEVLLRSIIREVLPHHVPEALRWDIVDFLGDEHDAAR